VRRWSLMKRELMTSRMWRSDTVGNRGENGLFGRLEERMA